MSDDTMVVAGLRLKQWHCGTFHTIAHGDVRVDASRTTGGVMVSVSEVVWSGLDCTTVRGRSVHEDADVALAGAISQIVAVAAPAVAERVVLAVVALQVAALEAAEVAA